MKYLIRKSVREDSFEIANVVATSWNETYKGIVPMRFLNELKENKEEVGQRLYDNFETYRQLVLEINNQIVGFIRYGEAEDFELTNCGEIMAFYIIKEYQGYGYGRKLFEMAKNDLKKQGFDKMIIACLKGNPTNEFYKHMGGKYLKDGVYKRLNLKENIYYYEI